MQTVESVSLVTLGSVTLTLCHTALCTALCIFQVPLQVRGIDLIHQQVMELHWMGEHPRASTASLVMGFLRGQICWMLQKT